MPDMVQIGNEVIGGMLWPDGKLPRRWKEFADLLQAGIAGVSDGSDDVPRPRVMIHIDRGGDLAATKAFFGHCAEYGVKFDVIGQSYYPWWHGGLDDLRANLAFMANNYPQDIMLVEVAYNWRRAEYREKPGHFPRPRPVRPSFSPRSTRRYATRHTAKGKAFSGGAGRVTWSHRERGECS